jgi:hypothetical protein
MSDKGPTKKHRTENQHYVPQLYLRGFTNASGRMFCYDKVSDKAHPTSTAAAAQEPYFYEIPPGSFREFTVPVNGAENALSALEGKWGPLHHELIKSADAGRISASLTVEYAPFVVMQWMRTKTYRETMREIAQKSMQSLSDDLVALNFPGHAKPKVKVGDKGMAAMHFQKLFDPADVPRMAEHLERHYWVVGINKTDHLLYTSDHPVVRRGNTTHQGRPCVGVLDPGIEFAFPLDSSHLLLILERTHFAAWKKFDNRSIELSAMQVRDYNGLQVMRSNQRLFCAQDDFDVAREVCAANPHIRDPNRPRVIVETTPILPAGVSEDSKEQMKNYMFVTALE